MGGTSLRPLFKFIQFVCFEIDGCIRNVHVCLVLKHYNISSIQAKGTPVVHQELLVLL